MIDKVQIVQLFNASGKKSKKQQCQCVTFMLNQHVFLAVAFRKSLQLLFFSYHSSIKRKIMPKIRFEHSFLTPVTH